MSAQYTDGNVVHGRGQYIDKDNPEVYSNTVESFLAFLKLTYKRTYHWRSPKYMRRFVTEFSGRFNLRSNIVMDSQRPILLGMEDRKLTRKNLIAPCQ